MKKVRLMAALDCSGSMGRTKKNIAKSNYMQMAKLLSQYDEPLPKFFSQFTTACVYSGCNYTNNPAEFFEESISGGTMISTGVEPILEEIKNTPEDIHNVVIIYSDGDNWGEDNEKLINQVIELSRTNSTVIFTRISVTTYISTVEKCLSNAHSSYDRHILISRLHRDEEIEEEFKRIILKSIEGEL